MKLGMGHRSSLKIVDFQLTLSFCILRLCFGTALPRNLIASPWNTNGSERALDAGRGLGAIRRATGSVSDFSQPPSTLSTSAACVSYLPPPSLPPLKKMTKFILKY